MQTNVECLLAMTRLAQLNSENERSNFYLQYANQLEKMKQVNPSIKILKKMNSGISEKYKTKNWMVKIKFSKINQVYRSLLFYIR